MPSLKEQYNTEIVPALMKELDIANRLAVPKLKKVVVNIGIGQNKLNANFGKLAAENIMAITGQKPVTRLARKAISGFKVRENDEVGLTVTLRGQRMYDFVQKVAHVALPRLRDFRGLDSRSFDQAGNLTIGLKEQIIFPEITTEKAENIHGLELTMVINSYNPQASQKLLEKFGFPFKKEQKNG